MMNPPTNQPLQGQMPAANDAFQAAHAERWPVICAACGGSASRIALRPTGRWLSLVVTVRRFRCDSTRCGWQGQLYG